MNYRNIASVSVLVMAAGILASPLASQTQPTGQPAANWKAPRTADGKPDLSGTWVNFDQTPFEQPAPGAAPARAAAPPPAAAAGGAAVGGGGGNAFGDKAAVVPRRPSMVVEPANGRVPVMDWAEKVRTDKANKIGDSWENGTTWDRCLTRGIPGAIFPAGYNNGYQIVQTPGSVSILYEMIHITRVIPTDGSQHLPANMRFWDGDSRGRWEGDTLVVDITNYNGKGDIATNAGSGRIRGIPASDQLHVVERFTRVSDSTINYEATITDPKVYSAPWKVAMPLTRDDSYQMFEYACHEGNVYFMNNALGGGRAQERTSEGAR